MKVDLLHSFAWDVLNEHLDQELGTRLGSGASHRIYAGLSQAVFEIVMGTALFYSHRKYYGLLSGETWAFDAVVPNLLKDGFQNQTLRAGALEDPKAWVASLSKETGFVIWAEDHPVLATYNAREELDIALNAARIISIRVSHSAFLSQPQEIRPYSVRICSLSPTLALAQVGARFKAPPLFAHRQFWDRDQILKQVRSEMLVGKQDSQLVDKFESQMDGSVKVGGFFRLPVEGPRLFDRALIYNPELSADFVAQAVALEQGISLAAPGFERRIENVNRCRWQPAPGFSTWWDPKPRDAVLAGLMVLSLEQIAQPGMLAVLEKASNQGVLNWEPPV